MTNKVKTKVEIQYRGECTDINRLAKTVQEDIRKQKIKAKDVENVNIYYKPDGKEIYYVVNMKDGTIFESAENGPLIFTE